MNIFCGHFRVSQNLAAYYQRDYITLVDPNQSDLKEKSRFRPL